MKMIPAGLMSLAIAIYPVAMVAQQEGFAESGNHVAQSGPDWESLSAGVQTIGFVQSELRVLSGSLEILLATWAAQASSNSGSRTDTLAGFAGLPAPDGFAFQRILILDKESGKLSSRVQTFGLAVREVPGSVIGMASEIEPVLRPGALFPGPDSLPAGMENGAGPGRYTWWGRLVIPLGPQEQFRPEEDRLVAKLLPLAARRGWPVERENEESGWQRVGAGEAILEPSFRYSEFTEEDWYFDPSTFTLYARIYAVYWQGENQVRFRLRLQH